MRQHKILTGTVLLLSIINFTLAAPVVVRGRPEVRLDANVARNVTAVSQERRGTSGSSTNLNVPGPVHAPSPRDSESDPVANLLSQMAYADSPPPTPDAPVLPVADSPSPPPPSPPLSTPDTSSPESSSGSDYASPSPGLPVAGSSSPPPLSPHPGQPGPSENRFPGQPSSSVNPDKLSKQWDKVLEESRLLGLMLAAGHVSSPPPPFPHSSQPGPSEGRFPGPPGFSASPGKLPATESAGVDPETHSLVNSEPPATEFWDKVLRESRLLGPALAPGSLLPPPPPVHHAAEAWLSTGSPSPDESMSMAGSLSPSSPSSPHSSPPGSSEDRFPSPSGSSANRQTGNQPSPPQSPGVDSETPSPLNTEPSPTEFLDKVLKGKLRRGDSGPDAVNLAQAQGHEYSNP